MSILVIDDSRLYREGLATAIRDRTAATEVRMACSPITIRAALAQGTPDIILLNLASAGSHDLLLTLCRDAPDSRIVVLGLSERDEDEIIACAEAGVAGYLMRSEPLDHLLRLMDALIAEGTLFSPRVAAVLLGHVRSMASQPAPLPRVPVLTGRQLQILELLDLGLSNKEIAHRLTIEVRTVKNHVHNLFERLGVHRRGEAVAVARGLQTPPMADTTGGRGRPSARSAVGTRSPGGRI